MKNVKGINLIRNNFVLTATCMAGTDIKFVQDTNKIDILIGGNLFTTYRYGSELTKPILYPVKSPLYE